MAYGKKTKVLIVLSFIFFALSIAAFVYNAIFIGAFNDIKNDPDNNIGEAVAMTVILILFVIFSAIFVLLDAVNICIGGILIKLTEKKLRIYYIIETVLSALMMAALFIVYAVIVY